MKLCLIIGGITLMACSACSEKPAAAPAVELVSAPSSTSPSQALDEMDRRQPVPLLPMMAHHQKENMRDHLVAVQEIVGAIAMSDFAGVERAANRIGFSDQMGRMCDHMGAGAPGFSKQAIDFHQTADRIAAAARAGDGAVALRELSATLQACTSCHATWKQQVVDEATWQRLTSLDPVQRDAPERHPM